MRVKPRTPNAQQALCPCAASQTTPTSLLSHTTRDRISKELTFPMKERKRMIWGGNISKENAHSTPHGMKEMPVYTGSGETALSGGKGIRTEKKNAKKKTVS